MSIDTGLVSFVTVTVGFAFDIQLKLNETL